jgi:hypothetical protein
MRDVEGLQVKMKSYESLLLVSQLGFVRSIEVL